MHEFPQLPVKSETSTKSLARRMLNVRLLVGTLIAAAVVLAAAYFWHGYQAGRAAEALLVRADTLEEEGDWASAAEYISRYLKLRPDDPRARVRLAETFDKCAWHYRRKRIAIDLYYRALGQTSDDPDVRLLLQEKRPALRRRLAELLLEAGQLSGEAARFASAETEAKKLSEGDSAGWRLLASAVYGQVQFRTLQANRIEGPPQGDRGEDRTKRDRCQGTIRWVSEGWADWKSWNVDDVLTVDEVFRQALDRNPGDIWLSQTLASIYRDQPELIRDGLQASEMAKRGQYVEWVVEQIREGGNSEFVDSVRQQLDKQVVSRIQDHKQTEGDLDLVGEKVRRKAREVDLKVLGAWSLDTRTSLADRCVDRMVAANPQSPEALLARYGYRRRYSLAGVEADLNKALELGPDDVAVLLAAAEHSVECARRAEKSETLPEEAGKHYRQAREHYQRIVDDVAPTNDQAWIGFGSALFAEGRIDDAVETWRRGLQRCGKTSVGLNMNLAYALIRQGKLAEAETPLDAADAAIARMSARLPESAKQSLGLSRDLLRARWLARKGRRREAIPLLKSITLTLQGSASEVENHLQAWLLLGGVYAALNQSDQAAIAYERAVNLQPDRVSTGLAVADAWATANRPDMAIPYYEQALSLERAAAADGRQGSLTAAQLVETAFRLAWVRYQRQLGLPVEDRKWDGVDQALTQVKALAGEGHLSRAWRIALLEADYVMIRGQQQRQLREMTATAKELLERAEQQFPESAALRQTLVMTYERMGLAADADRALKEFGRLTEEPADVYSLRARLCSQRKQFQQAREALEEGIRTTPAGKHSTFEYGLLRLALQQGDVPGARRQLLLLHQKEPDNEKLVHHLAELALEADDLEQVNRWEKKIAALEGPDSLFAKYYQARRLLSRATGPDDPGLIKATTLQEEIQLQRPAWPANLLLKGRVLERQGRSQQAIEAYQEAVRLGLQQVAVYERLIHLLSMSGRSEEADQYFAEMRDAPSAASLESLEISVAAQRGQLDRALKLAERAVRRRPNDALTQVWLGQMLWANQQRDEAQAAFQRAVQLAPTDVRTVGALLRFYAGTGRMDRVKELLQKLAEDPKLTGVDRELSLARGYELIGQGQQAEAHYREADRLAPDDASVKMRLATFLIQSDLDKAVTQLRKVLELEPGFDEARRKLAFVLAWRGGKEGWQKATELLEQPGTAGGVSATDQRLQAVLLIRRGGEENLQKSRRILENLTAASGRPLASDRVLLANVCERLGDLQAARQQYIGLLGRAEPQQMHLAAYVDLLLRNDLLEEAAQRLDQLEQAAPDDPVALGLRARWMHAKGQTAQIETLIEGWATRQLKTYANDQQQETRLCLVAGNLYSTLKQHQAAERWYRRLRKLVPKDYGSLARSLARQGLTAEAIRLCLEAAKSDASSRPAMALAVALASGKPTADDFQLAEPLLSQTAKRLPDDVNLLFSVAGVRILQGQIQPAVELYRQVLQLKPGHVLALNNLATLLSEIPGRRKEALHYINQAIDIAGPQAGLLDTKGMILVLDGRPSEAVPLLREAASNLNPDPRYDFHLAIAYWRAGDELQKARDALRKAHDGDLNGQILTQTDRQLLKELEQKLQLR